MEEPRTENQEPGIEGAYSFRNLILWQKAQDLALAIVKLTEALPRNGAAQIMTRQIVGAAASVGANIAEGHGRFSLAAHRHYLSIAKGSACETDGWLDLLRRAGYVDADTEGKLHRDCAEIIRMLTAKMRDLERRESSVRPLGLREDASPYDAHDYQPGSRVWVLSRPCTIQP